MSARPRFRLQSALDHRERREDLLREDLAQALGALSAGQERAVAAARDAEAELAGLRALMHGGSAPLHELRARHDDLALARARAAHERAEADRLEAIAEERRGDLIRAAQDREALVQLRGRAHDAHRREGARAEVIALDELSARRGRAARRRAA